MFSLGPSYQYYLFPEPTDMRKSFDGLSGLVRSRLGQDPLSGNVFIFINKRCTLMKLLKWEAGGFVLFFKRLEQGTFEFPDNKSPLRWMDLVLLIDGIKLRSVRRKARFNLPKTSSK